MENPNQRLHQLGQSLWLDNLSRHLLDSGKLVEYRDHYAVSGLTSNPTIFEHAIASGDDYTDAFRRAGRGEPESLFFTVALEDLRRAAQVFAPVHRRTCGVDGWVSLEVSPLLADDAARTVEQAQALHRRAGLDNLFVKVPGTAAGAQAIEELIYRGVPVNVTLLFSPAQYRAAARAYLRGLERRLEEGRSPDVASVASLFVSRWDVKVADRVPAERRNHLGVAVAGWVYAEYCDLLASSRLRRLMNAGARPQRLLWASTGTKDPQASDVLYVEALAAPLTINTMPEQTLQAFADHGRCERSLEADAEAARRAVHEALPDGADVDTLAAELQEEGKQKFSSSWNALLAAIRKRAALAA